MDNLTIAVIAIAVAQALTILLSIGRQREIKKLRELVDEQRLHIVKLSAWLARRNAGQSPRIKSDRERIREPTANKRKAPKPAITPKDLPATTPRTTEEEDTARVMKAINWLKELQSAQPRRMKPDGNQTMADAPALAIAPKDLPERPRLIEGEMKEMVDADKAREIVAVLHGKPPNE